MPIVVEALDRPHYNAWVMTHAGAKVDGAPEAPRRRGIAHACCRRCRDGCRLFRRLRRLTFVF
jgi:hypothetical protein